ncbi:hypothetical protein [Streptomyces sp. NPDC059489]|uniref:hypothetical protein n=1 Tax=Streptomyces sp. NPDC059489 TaxID=3346849 RepID=UPI0036B8EC06
MTLSPLARTASGVITAAWQQGRIARLADQAAEALESAQLLQSPQTAAELERLRKRVAELEARVAAEECRCPEPATQCSGCGCGCHARGPEASADKLTRLLAPTQALREADRVVAYRNPDRPGVLLCRPHGDGWWGLTSLTSEDLPDGGVCTYGDPADPSTQCGADVLITPPQTEAGEGR